MRRAGTSLLVLVASLSLPATAAASWHPAGGGNGYGGAKSLAAGNTPAATVSNRSVTVNWTASGGSVPISGYIVTRYDNGGSPQTIGSACTGTIAGTSCTETGVPSGTWRYSVTPVNQNWRGAESSQSTAVTVNAPTLTLTPTTVSSLPATLTGSIANFIPGQTVAFKLDNPTTGTALTGSITPTPVPASGSATVSVTIPAGTSAGAHTVYAVGSGSDTAGRAITVALPVTFTTTGWNFHDASSGTDTDVSDPLAFAGDSLTYETRGFDNTFKAVDFVDFDFNAPLAPSTATSSVNFNFSFAAHDDNVTNCFYVEARRISTNALVATYGSSVSPFCAPNPITKNVQTPFTVALPAVTSTTIANDLRLRVYASSSGGNHALIVDRATVSGTAGSLPFTLYENSFTDNANGGTNAATPWLLAAAGDSALYTDLTNWPLPIPAAPTKFLQLKFPSYVPSGATISSVTFNRTYRASGNNLNAACYYFDVLSGATVIGTHGNSLASQSCSSSGSTFTTDNVSLTAEVTTAAQANNLSVKLYGTSAANRKSVDDLDTVTITYVP